MTRNIPPGEWIEYFHQFSSSHAGWPTTIEVLSPEAGPQHLADDLPLQGISFDTAGTRPSSLQVAAGDRPDAHVEHVVDLPLRINIVGDDPRSHRIDVQIEPSNGPMTLLHIRRPD